MEGFIKEQDFERSKIKLEIAEKELEIYRMGGESAHHGVTQAEVDP